MPRALFGQQKGATSQIISQLDDDLQKLSQRTSNDTQARHLGAGAAGGLGFGVLAFMNGKLVNGFGLVAEMVGFPDRLENATYASRVKADSIHKPPWGKQ